MTVCKTILILDCDGVGQVLQTKARVQCYLSLQLAMVALD